MKGTTSPFRPEGIGRERRTATTRDRFLCPLLEAAEAIVLQERIALPTPATVATPTKSTVPEIAFEQDPKNHIVVPERLGKVHPLVQKTKDALKGKQATERGRVFPWGGTLDVTVGPKSVPRALRIMQALIGALIDRGHVVKTKAEGRSTIVEMLGESLEFNLVERTKQVRSVPPRSYRAYELEPTGILVLRVSRTYPVAEVCDTKHKALEDRLNEFIIKLAEEAQEKKRLHEHWARQEALWQERQRLREIEEAKRREEEKKIEQWDEWMTAWRRAREVRAFARVMRRRVTPIDEGSQVEEWLTWAEAYAEQLDPLEKLRLK